MDLVEVAIVDDQFDEFDHVVRLVGGVGDDGRQRLLHPIGPVGRSKERWRLHVVLRQEGEEVPDLLEGMSAVTTDEVGDSRYPTVRAGTAEGVEGDFLPGDRLDHVGPGYEEMRCPLDLVDEIGHGGRINGTSGAGTHDQ